MNNLLDELQSIEASLDEGHLAKMKGLRDTEDKFKKFLDAFPAYKKAEVDLLLSKEKAIKAEMEKLKGVK